jgi:hypothetical protein
MQDRYGLSHGRSESTNQMQGAQEVSQSEGIFSRACTGISSRVGEWRVLIFSMIRPREGTSRQRLSGCP